MKLGVHIMPDLIVTCHLVFFFVVQVLAAVVGVLLEPFFLCLALNVVAARFLDRKLLRLYHLQQDLI